MTGSCIMKLKNIASTEDDATKRPNVVIEKQNLHISNMVLVTYER